MSRTVITTTMLIAVLGCVSATPLTKIHFEEELAGNQQAKVDRYECM